MAGYAATSPFNPASAKVGSPPCYIATASILGGDAHRLAGSLFALDVDVPGAAAFRAKV